MISGNPLRSLGAALALLLWAGGAAAAPLTLDMLLAGFADVAAADARFTETLTLAVLETPLTSSGSLRYRRPDYLKKQVETPAPSMFEIAGDVVTVETERGRQTLSLRTQPVIRAFAAAYRATLAGDRAALEAHYRIDLDGTVERWTLRLQPIDDSLRRRIRSIELTGSGSRIHGIETMETSGDRSLMTIAPDAR